MSKLHLKFVQSFGGYHYFRRPGFPRLRLPGIVGSEEFLRAYQQALAAAPVAIGASSRSGPGSVSAAIAGYYQSQAFRALKGGSPAMRRAILERFREAHGDKSVALLPRKFVVVLLDTMEPFAARNWLKAIRALMKHCTAHGLIKEDPTQGVRLPPVKSDGHHTWSDDEIAAYEAAHPVGTKARLAFALLLYTAQRRRDVIRMGPQHVQNGELRVVQKKTRKPLILPIRPELQAVLDATPTGHLTFLVTKSGKPYPANDFSEQFRVWCNASGLPTACVVHGLRKAACRRMAEAGYSVSEIAAWSGHRTLSEIKRYTDGVDQARLARNALQREQNGTRTVKPEQILTVSKG